MKDIVMIVGANGQLGNDLMKTLETKENLVALPFYHGDDVDWSLEVKDHQMTREKIIAANPSIIINTSAYHNVDQCETNPSEAYAVNSSAVKNIAEICSDRGIKLVHLSSDYVFNGEKQEPYTEEDIPDPKNVYGISKIAGENHIRNTLPEHFIVRTSGIQGLAKSSVKGRNFVELMLKLGKEKGAVRVVDDQIISPTYSLDLAEKIIELAQTDNYGTYHLTNGGECSWYEFAENIFKLGGLNVDMTPISTEQAKEEFNYVAKRALYTVLDSVNLQKAGLENLRHWNGGLEAYFKEREAQNGI